jgi:hypothetical protein
MCRETRQACFCSEACEAAAEATPGGVSLAMRRRLQLIPWDTVSAEEALQLRFLVQMIALQEASACAPAAAHALQRISDMHAGPPVVSDAYHRLAAALQHVILSPVDVRQMLAIEGCNTFGVLRTNAEV